MKTEGKLLVILMCLFLMACVGQGPQRPSRWLGKSPEADTAQLQLIEFNQQMVSAADKELVHYVELQDEAYALYRGGVWVHVLEHGNDDLKPYTYGQTCPLHLRVYAMDGSTLLADMRQTFHLGNSDVPHAVTDVVRELHPGARARLIVPWYSAFGIQGKDRIQPYQNVIIDLTIEE